MKTQCWQLTSDQNRRGSNDRIQSTLHPAQRRSSIMATRTGKMQQWLNYKIRVTIQDRRDIVGQFLAFDRYMNLIIADAEEFRRIGGKSGGGPGQKRKEAKVLKRTLGLVLLRGENIVSLSIEGPPPPEENRNRQAPVLSSAGVGIGKPVGRGAPLAQGLAPPGLPSGLAGPVKGLGGPAPSSMMPSAGAPKFAPGHMPPGMPPKYPPSFPPYGAPPGMYGAPPGMPPKFPPGMPPMYGAPPGMPPFGPGGMPPGMPKYPGPGPHQ